MSKLIFCDYEILSADLGEENLMPDIKNIEYIHAGFTLSEKVREEDRKYFGKGMIKTILPYGIQDNYNRDRKPRKFKAAILENENLKAVFLPELGGRLWSLYHKKLNRELLYVNPVFQPGNLAIRNAWFSGGIEWNIGIKGHNPLTCSPMYAAKTTDENGNPVLRMYEYERIRGLSYYMDFLLPEGSEVLYVKTTVENTSDEDKYMYWWSNIAVPETPGTRVVAPCDEAFLSSYGENKYYVDIINVPVPEGTDTDITYSTNVNRSQDYFFRIEEEKQKWISAIGSDGVGLVQFSTPELIGRKVFVWGQGQGGKNWSNWLSGQPVPYIEIQAGLARTQLEHIIMKKESTMSWVEGYAAASISPSQVHGDYKTAVSAVENYIESIRPTDDIMRKKFEDFKKCEIVQHGSGWGYIENLIRHNEGKAPVSEEVCYPETALGNREKIWLDFINNGYMNEEIQDYPPLSYHVSGFWKDLYEKQIEEGKANSYMYLQYGVNKYADGDVDGAYECFLKSCEMIPNPWGFRNLSMIEKNEYGNFEKSVGFMEKAILLNSSYRGLVVNCAQVMLGAGKYERWLEIFDGLFEPLKKDGRLLIYKAIALMNLKRYHEATEIINTNFVLSDIKEGEVSVSHIWFELYSEIVAEKYNITDKAEIERIRETEYPLPGHLDFRME